jgi:hypothetical protein
LLVSWRGRDGAAGRAPVVGQELPEVALLDREQKLEDVLQVGPRIVPIGLGRLDHAQDHGSALAGLLRAQIATLAAPVCSAS